MIDKLLAMLRRKPGSTRGFSHGVLLASVLGVIVTFVNGQLGGWPLTTWLIGYVAASAALELALRTGKRAAVSGDDYQDVADQLASAATLIEAAGEIDILSGTLRTFTERRANIRAMHVRFVQGHPVRVLIMNPEGEGVNAIAKERQDQGRNDSSADLGKEIRGSIRRLLLEFSPVELSTVLRYYSNAPHSSVHRYGEVYVATLYSVGRGSSSSCIAVHRSDHARFCESLKRGFDELWTACESTGPSGEDLEALVRTS